MSSTLDHESPLVALSNDFAAAVERAGAATVAVQARHRVGSSGIHWRQGLIVTADHAVRRDDDITVTLTDGAQIDATLVGRDPDTDIALLRIEAPPGLSIAQFGSRWET